MFAITLEQKQYKTYILTDQLAQTRLEVVPERGGIITRWQVRGQDWLYLDTERYADPNLSVRGGVPILFPICGNLPDNTYEYEGKTYRLKQHGFARDRAWEVCDRYTQEGVGIALSLTSDDETRAVYPFDFRVTFTYRLQGNSLLIHQQYTNHSAVPMPFSTGFHPYFPVSDKSQLQLEIPATEFQTKADPTPQPFTGQFDYNQDEIDVAFHPVSQTSASVIDAARKQKLTLSYDPTFTTLVFWTVKGKDFYCLEPWSAPRNAMNSGQDLTYLEPGATLETQVKFSVSPV
ncbi:MAG: aldose epimerase [Oculatellaceae cyanobacterium Prado106]|jgi:galactose mutarotase-like enzyme|nr:aldose epimerase [Oculatellaceae cyanobacterium Prado106]